MSLALPAGAPVPWLRVRLSIHMFLTAGVIGVWLPLLSRYLESLGYPPTQIMIAMGTVSLANILSNLLAGQIADRWMSTDRLLGILNGLAGGFLILAYHQRDFWTLGGLLLGAAIFFVPSFPLGASLSFHHLPEPARQFAGVRVWGTIGWIAGASAFAGWLHWKGKDRLEDCLLLSAVVAFANALFSLLLPRTPPRRDAQARSAVGKALGMLKDFRFAYFIGALFVFQLFAAFFFPYAGLYLPRIGIAQENLGYYLSMGTVTEIFMIFLLPFVYGRLGARATITLGISLWAIRFAIFSLGGPLGLVVASLTLHGPGFAFSRIAATLYVDRICERDVRASAQSLLSMTIDGAGPFLGAVLSGQLLNHFTQGLVRDWRSAWLVPTLGCAAVAVAFAVGFRPRSVTPAP